MKIGSGPAEAADVAVTAARSVTKIESGSFITPPSSRSSANGRGSGHRGRRSSGLPRTASGHARALLEAGDFDVVGEAADGATGVAAATELRPEVVLLDIHLPDEDGFAVAQRLEDDGVACAIVLVSSRDISSFRRRLAANPAWNFIPKSELSGEALAATLD